MGYYKKQIKERDGQKFVEKLRKKEKGIKWLPIMNNLMWQLTWDIL